MPFPETRFDTRIVPAIAVPNDDPRFETLRERPAKGEITLLIGASEAKDGAGVDSSQGLAERVEELMRQAKLDRKEALKLAAKERGLTRREAYDRVLEERQGEE